MIEIKKSHKLKILRVSFVSVITVTLLLVSSTIIRAFRELINIDAPLARFIVTSIIIIVALASIATAWARDRNKKYVLDDEELIISNYRFGAGSAKTIIKLDPKNVSSIKLNQSFMGKMFDYGTISLEVDSYSQKEIYSLANIDRPSSMFSEINSHLSRKNQKN